MEGASHFAIYNWKSRLARLAFPAVLLAVCTAAFGLLIPWLGYYQDDWYQIWFGRAFGSTVFINYYAEERPFMAALYLLTTPVLGHAPLTWQMFALGMRWLAGLSVYWSLRQVWPQTRWLAVVVSLLYVVYPGFRQQHAAVIYSHYFLQFAIQMGSIGLMALAVRAWKGGLRRRYGILLPLSLMGALVGIFSSEYFFGLELVRPLCLWWVMNEDQGRSWGRRLQQALAHWLPYLAALILFLIWRLFIYQFPTYQPVLLQSPHPDLLTLGLRLARTIARDVVDMGLLAWALPLQIAPEAVTRLPSTLMALGLAIASGAGVWLYLYRLNRDPGNLASHNLQMKAALQMLLTGIVGVLAAGWPFWFVGLPVDLELNSGSRFGIAFMLPASLILAGAWELLSSAALGRSRWVGLYKTAVLAMIVGLAVGHAFKDANYFRQLHRSQAQFFQQLAWRIPQLEPGTTILVNDFEQRLRSGDNALTATVNWIYDPQPPYGLDYMVFYLPERLASGNLPGLKPDLAFAKQFRTTSFQGSTSRMLVIYDSYPHCLRVLDPAVDADTPRPMDMPKEMHNAIPLSNLELIEATDANPAQLSPALFKYLPAEDSWCAYFEKADLARQQGDWQAIVRLADTAFREPPKVDSTFELLPFIEGYARSGQVDKARELSLLARQAIPEGRWFTTEILCQTWARIEHEAGMDAKKIKNELGCN